MRKPFEPTTLLNQNRQETQSVPTKQSFQEFAMAGGGVPAQYKGREHVWHAKVNKHEAHMAGGGSSRDEVRATPRNKVIGAAADVLKKGHEFVSKPFGYQNPPAEMLSELIGVPAVSRTLDRMSYGEPLTNYGKANVPLIPDDTFDALSSISPMIGPSAKMAAKGAKAVGRGALDLAKSDAAYNLTQKALASPVLAAARPMHVIKPTGGNFLTGRVEKDVKGLKPHDSPTPEDKAWIKEKREELLASPESEQRTRGLRAVDADIAVQNRNEALNKWVDSNLSNYIKKQMATPDDPVRALAEQGITHKKGLDPALNYASLREQREKAGFPGEGMGQSPLAKAWEQAADEAIATHRAGDIQEMPDRFVKSEEAQAKMVAARDELDKKFIEHLKKAGLNDREVDSLVRGNTYPEKAKMVGDTAFLQANAEYRATQSPMMNSYMELGRQNPWISKVDPETTIYSPYTSDLGFDHIMDVLREDLTAGRIRPEQMNKISITDAVRRTHQYDEDMAKKMAESKAKVTEGMPVHKEYPEGYKWIELTKPKDALPEGYKILPDQSNYRNPDNELFTMFDDQGNAVSTGASEAEAIKLYKRQEREKQLADALKYEGETMGHCVGGYCPHVLEGKSRIYSLRDAKGEPHVTVEVQPSKTLTPEKRKAQIGHLVNRMLGEGMSEEQALAQANKLYPESETAQRIVQIKGKQNRAPKEEYLPYVQDFVKGGKWSDVGDLQNTGLYSAKDVDRIMPEGVQMSRNARTLALGRARRAGELPEYMTREEYEAMIQKHVPEDVWAAEKAQRAAEDDELLRQLRPLEEGMAHGGEAHMAGGGAIKAALAKLGKFATESDLKAIKEAGRTAHEQDAFIRAAKDAEIEEKLKSMPARSKAANIEMGMYHPVGGGTKLSKPFEAMHSTRVKNPKVDTPEVRIMTPEDLYREEAGLFPLVGDKADTGTFLTHIGEKELEVPVGLGGGPRYMDANLNPANRSRSAAWESGTGRVMSLGNQARRIGEGGRPAYGIYTAGSGTNTDFNIMGANAILQQLGQSKLTKKAEKAFDQAMRAGTKAFPPIPDWPGIRSPQAEDMLLDKSQGILRTKLFDTMGKEDFQSMGFPDVPATRKAIMDPQLLDVPTHEAGFRIARMDPTGRVIEDPLHPSDYPTAMAGELAGQLNTGVDYKDMFSTHFANRRLLSQPESGDYYSFSRAFPIQYADQEWLDKIKKAQEAKDKLIKTGSYAKGGDVKPKGGLAAATKSCSCHD